MSQKGLVPILIVVGIAILGIGGYFVYTSLQKSSSYVANPPITKPSANPTESTNSEKTANWKTYADQKNNFTIKYPPNFRAYQTSGAGLQIDLDQTRGMPTRWLRINVTNSSDPQLKPFMSLNLAKSYKPQAGGGIWTRLPDTTIDNQTAKLFDGLNFDAVPPMKMIILSKSDNVYEISYTSINGLLYGPEVSIDFVSTFNQILSTFKFTQ